MYLIKREQFESVVKQENTREGMKQEIDLNDIKVNKKRQVSNFRIFEF